MEKDVNMENGNKIFCLIIALLIDASSFAYGELSSRKRLLFFFDKIEVNGEVNVFLEEGKRNREATLYADSEIIDSVITRVSQRTLYIDANNTFALGRRLPFVRLNAKRIFPVEIIISIDNLREINVHDTSNLTSVGLRSDRLSVFCSTAGKVHIENLSCPAMLLRHEGTGTVVLRGKTVKQLEAQVFGNGSLRAEDLHVEQAALTHQGKGSVHLSAQTWLDARMRGTGSLLLHRKPQKMVVDQAGQGTVRDIIEGKLPYLDLNASIPQLGIKYDLGKRRKEN